MVQEHKPEGARFRTQEDQYNDPRFKRELECEIHIATGCRVTVYAEERPTGLDQCSTYNRWVGHWSTPNWHYTVTRFVSVEEMERAVAEAVISERNRCRYACASEFLTHHLEDPTDIAYQAAVGHCIASIMEGTLNV